MALLLEEPSTYSEMNSSVGCAAASSRHRQARSDHDADPQQPRVQLVASRRHAHPQFNWAESFVRRGGPDRARGASPVRPHASAGRRSAGRDSEASGRILTGRKCRPRPGGGQRKRRPSVDRRVRARAGAFRGGGPPPRRFTAVLDCAPVIVDVVAGARPNFMKVAPGSCASSATARAPCAPGSSIRASTTTTGCQRVFLRAARRSPPPTCTSGSARAPHGAQTARVLELLRATPDVVRSALVGRGRGGGT